MFLSTNEQSEPVIAKPEVFKTSTFTFNVYINNIVMSSRADCLVLTFVILVSIIRSMHSNDSDNHLPICGSFKISPNLLHSSPAMKNSFLQSNKKCHRTISLYIYALVLLNANDCHPNPGPRNLKFPCQICGKACKWSKTVRSVACNNCELWYHTSCMNMKTWHI